MVFDGLGMVLLCEVAIYSVQKYGSASIRKWLEHSQNMFSTPIYMRGLICFFQISLKNQFLTEAYAEHPH